MYFMLRVCLKAVCLCHLSPKNETRVEREKAKKKRKKKIKWMRHSVLIGGAMSGGYEFACLLCNLCIWTYYIWIWWFTNRTRWVFVLIVRIRQADAAQSVCRANMNFALKGQSPHWCPFVRFPVELAKNTKSHTTMIALHFDLSKTLKRCGNSGRQVFFWSQIYETNCNINKTIWSVEDNIALNGHEFKVNNSNMNCLQVCDIYTCFAHLAQVASRRTIWRNGPRPRVVSLCE